MMSGMTMMQTGAVPQITLAHRLRIAREYAGLEQAELAQRADMSRTSVVNYELGYRVPRRLYLRSIAEATGVDLHWLETGEAPTTNVIEAPATEARPKGLEPLTFCFGDSASEWTVEDDYALAFWSLVERQGDLDADSTLSAGLA